MEPMMISVHYEKVYIQYEKETLYMFSNRVGANPWKMGSRQGKQSERNHVTICIKCCPRYENIC